MYQTRNYTLRNSSWNAPYTFSGKEKDVETGYGYFGARYYDSGMSIWLSVDPMSDKYPNLSPYNYCANNPVILVDPDGMRIYNIIGEEGVSIEINDGVDETFDIARSDFDALNDIFNNDTRETYDNYFSALVLGTKGYEIALSARDQEGSSDYAFNVKKGDFPANTDKCNKFVYDILRENDAIEEQKQPGCPPLAGKYANPKAIINGLTVVTIDPTNLKLRDIKLGDVIGGAYRYANGASGHVEIVTQINKDGIFLTKGASDNYVLTRTKGYEMLKGTTKTPYKPITVRRAN